MKEAEKIVNYEEMAIYSTSNGGYCTLCTPCQNVMENQLEIEHRSRVILPKIGRVAEYDTFIRYFDLLYKSPSPITHLFAQYWVLVRISRVVPGVGS